MNGQTDICTLRAPVGAKKKYLHLIVEDALCGVRHEWQVVCPVDHLSVIIIETANL